MHEGTHALIRNMIGKHPAPPWYDEGLATYLQFWDLRGDLKKNLASRYGRSFYRKHLSDHCLKDPKKEVSLTRLAGVGADQWNPDQMGPAAAHNYAQAENLIDFLLATDKNKLIFNRISASISSGKGSGQLFSPEEIKGLEPLWRESMAKVSK